jgi:hypothetical protein
MAIAEISDPRRSALHSGGTVAPVSAAAFRLTGSTTCGLERSRRPLPDTAN